MYWWNIGQDRLLKLDQLDFCGEVPPLEVAPRESCRDTECTVLPAFVSVMVVVPLDVPTPVGCAMPVCRSLGHFIQLAATSRAALLPGRPFAQTLDPAPAHSDLGTCGKMGTEQPFRVRKTAAD